MANNGLLVVERIAERLGTGNGGAVHMLSEEVGER